MKIIILFLCLFSSCSSNFDTEWWRHTILYEILPYSFKDSNGDGTGDIKGITSKLDYLDDLGIETIHLTPVYESTFYDMGYDITDYYKIDPRYGTMQDFDQLVSEMNKRNMKLILDLVINHSSDKHNWFQKSVDRIPPYTDFYIWKDSKGFDNDTKKEIPPNKWISLFNWMAGDYEYGTAWKWNEKRKQFFFHHFMAVQPDFDLRNEQVTNRLKKMIEFWLDKGVAGFRLDAAIFLIEDKDFRDDNPMLRMFNQPETYELIHQFRLFLDEYNKNHGGFERIFIAEAHTGVQHLLKYYGKEDYPVTHFPYTFNLEHIREDVTAIELNSAIEGWIKMLPTNAISAWMTQDHDCHRVGSRVRPEYSDILTIISMTLPGTVGIYYGQEIAMLNGYIQDGQMKDFSGRGTRDPARLIMQWDDSLNAGFSSNSATYLPANVDYFIRNVQFQKQQKISHYKMFKDLSNLRKTDTFKYGDFEKYIPSDWIYIFTRSYENHIYLIITNLNTILTTVTLSKLIPDLPSNLVVAASSVNAKYEKGTQLETELSDGFIMRPLSCIVLEGYSL